MKLIDEARWVLSRAWSVRLLIIAAILSGLEVTIQAMIAFAIKTPMPSGVFAALAGLVSLAALIARFVAQVRD